MRLNIKRIKGIKLTSKPKKLKKLNFNKITIQKRTIDFCIHNFKHGEKGIQILHR